MSGPLTRLAVRLAALACASILVAASAGCGEVSADGDDDEIGQDEAEQTSAAVSWFRVTAEPSGALALEPAFGGKLRCADGAEAPRCVIQGVDLKRAGIEPAAEARSRIANLAREDAVMVLGRAAVRTTGEGEAQKKALRLVATRIYENVARASADGELYEVTRLEAPEPCKLTRSIPSPRGPLAPPIVEPFEGTCAHRARKLSTSDTFDIDQPDWRIGTGSLGAEVATDLEEDLAQGNGVVVVGRWVRSEGPVSRPKPAQVWRDMKRSLSH